MRKKISINEGWKYLKLEGNIINEKPKILKDYEIINIPHILYSKDDYYRGAVVYQKELIVSYSDKEEIFLEFASAENFCRVFINDTFIGEHEGGYSTFRFDITNTFKSGEQNTITVFLENSESDYINPLIGDFNIYGGLYRDVNIITVPHTHFDLMYYGSNGLIISPEVMTDRKGKLLIEQHIINAENADVLYEIYDKEDTVTAVAKVDASDKKIEMIVHNPVLWNGKECPEIYTLKATLENEGYKDNVEINFGFRTVEISANEGFFLNDKHMRINGVSKHQDYDGIYSAVEEEHLDSDMKLIMEVGANAVRLSHYQHPQYFYDLCDKEGLVVWAEIPVLMMNESKQLLDNACQQLKELIFQNIHHPSICFWGLQNEIALYGEEDYMYEGVRVLESTLKDLCPTGISASANLYSVKNASLLNKITDLVGYNIYFGWYYGNMEDYDMFLDRFHLDNPDIPIGISEYGVDSNLNFHSQTPRVKDYSEEFQALYHETVYPIFNSKEYLWGSFIWNMFDFGSFGRDEGGTKGKNCKGLVTFDREIRKDAFYFYKAFWSREPFVHIVESRFKIRVDEYIAIKVYSNQKQVSLYVNNSVIKTIEGNTVFCFNKIKLTMGENRIMAVSDGIADEIILLRQTEPEKSYKFTDPNPGFNVNNWFEEGQTETDIFPVDSYSLQDSVCELLECNEVYETIKEIIPELILIIDKFPAGLPLMRILSRISSEFDEEKVKKINKKLNTIKKLSV